MMTSAARQDGFRMPVQKRLLAEPRHSGPHQFLDAGAETASSQLIAPETAPSLILMSQQHPLGALSGPKDAPFSHFAVR